MSLQTTHNAMWCIPLNRTHQQIYTYNYMTTASLCSEVDLKWIWIVQWLEFIVLKLIMPVVCLWLKWLVEIPFNNVIPLQNQRLITWEITVRTNWTSETTDKSPSKCRHAKYLEMNLINIKSVIIVLRASKMCISTDE